MAIRVRNPQPSALALPYPLLGTLPAGGGVVLLLTLAQFAALAGAEGVKCFDVDEVPDLAGDDFALSLYNGPAGGNFSELPLQVKTITGQEKDWGEVDTTLELDLAQSQFHRVTLGGATTITAVRSAAAPAGVAHFTLLLLGTDAETVIFDNLVFTGTGPDFTESPVWVVTIYPDGAGVFRASALPFDS